MTSANTDLPEVLTTEEVADLFGVKPHAVARWLKAGLLDGCLIEYPGRRLRFRRDAVLQLRKGETSAPQDLG